VKDLRAFEDGLHEYFANSQSALLNEIATKKALDDGMRNALKESINEYKKNFLAQRNDARNVETVKA
jgi:F-type H+-transporting ATPase subunit alpha